MKPTPHRPPLPTSPAGGVTRINGIPIQAANDELIPEHWRQRVFTELLRQQAQREGLLAADDDASDDGIISEQAAQAIDQLVARQCTVPEPDLETCKRYYDHHPSQWTTGEEVEVQHILFAVTDGVDVNRLRERAEQTWIELRSHDPLDISHFGEVARQLSNCPSGSTGGHLGWLGTQDCVPELAHALFGQASVGILGQLVQSRFGFHVVQVLNRRAGVVQPFESVRSAVIQQLQQQTFAAQLRSYLLGLADDAILEGVDLAQLAPVMSH